MKKLLVVLVSLLMVIGLVACGGSGGNKEKTTLVFWGHQNDPWNASWREIAKKFEAENDDITIEFEFFPYDEFEAKVMTSLMNKEQGADIYELWGGWGVDFAPTGALAPLPDDLADMIRNEFYEPTYGALEYEGKIYGFPLEFNIECGGLLVNLELAEKYNVKMPTTWDELIREAKKAVVFQGNNMMQKGFDFVNWDSTPYLLTCMILSKGGAYQDADGNFTFNTAIGADAYQTLYDLIVVDKVTDMAGISGGDDIEGYQLLFNGSVLFVPRGPWVIAEGEMEMEVYYKEDFDYIEMPWYGSQEKFPAETGWALAINNSSTKQEAASRFLNFVSRDDILEEHNIASAQIPAKKSVAQDPSLLEKMPFAAPLIKILDKAQFIGFFNTDILKEKITENFEEFVNGEYDDVYEALEALDEALNDEING